MLSDLCSSQHVTQLSRRSLLLSCSTYKNSNSDNRNSENDNPYKFRDYRGLNPLQKTFKILTDDVRDSYRRKKNLIQQIARAAKRDADMKAGRLEETETMKENINDSESITSGPEMAIWPSHCDVLVVGGGAVGSSVAYHLKEQGRDGLNVVVVEEDPSVSRILYSLYYCHAFLLPIILLYMLRYVLFYFICITRNHK